MTKGKANIIFEKYNPLSDVVRCPYGRAPVRNMLDLYAKAAVNLYGAIKREELLDIFNQQNPEKTTAQEIYVLLLPLVFKEECYCFYKENIVHYSFFDNLNQVDYLLQEQADKPRYIPEKDEFLKYLDENYTDKNPWSLVADFMFENFGYSRNTAQAYVDTRSYITNGYGINELGPILDRNNIIFESEDLVQYFINLLMDASNNTRIWQNKGYTPSEIHKMTIKKQNNIIKFPIEKKIKVMRNDSCPCGSGKKYKKCCGSADMRKTAKLSSDECKLFYETWYGLMAFVNEKEAVIKDKIKPEYPNQVSDRKTHKVREVLWENPSLISEYINKSELTQEKRDILKLWETKHKKGSFILLEHQTEYSVCIGSNDEGEDRLYGIKGLSNPISYILQRDLPVTIKAVLLPFKGKIVYDSFLISMGVKYGQGAKKVINEMYDKAIKHGIITTL